MEGGGKGRLGERGSGKRRRYVGTSVEKYSPPPFLFFSGVVPEQRTFGKRYPYFLSFSLFFFFLSFCSFEVSCR